MAETKAYFKNIRSQILKELGVAEASILVAVAWLTDKGLLAVLEEKARGGCHVSVLAMDDEINARVKPLYDQINAVGGHIYLVPNYDGESIMHNKFCVIDRRTVITGSYNWTYRAENRNEENIAIAKDATSLASDFIEQFHALVLRYYPNTIISEECIDIGKVIQRLEAIRQLAALGDFQDMQKQAERIRQLSLDRSVLFMLDLIATKKYPEAIEAIGLFLKKYQGLISYIDPEASVLRFQLDALNLQLEEACFCEDEAKKIIVEFERRYLARLGDVIATILKLKMERAELFFECDRKKERVDEEMDFASKYEGAKRDWQTYQDTVKSTRSEPEPLELSAEEKEDLKRKYRKASHLCHPDKVSKERKKEAEKIFATLNEANKRNDLQAVTDMLRKLETDGFAPVELVPLDDKIVLKCKLERVHADIEKTERSVKELLAHSAIRIMESIENLDTYLDEQRVLLEAEWSALEREVARLRKELGKMDLRINE